MQWRYRSNLAIGIGFAKENVWSRAARRKQRQMLEHSTSMPQAPEEDVGDDPALGVKIRLQSRDEGVVIVMIRWLQGSDSVLFESFCGMMKRQLGD